MLWGARGQGKLSAKVSYLTFMSPQTLLLTGLELNGRKKGELLIRSTDWNGLNVNLIIVYRKHDRKGIARRVSNFSSEGESVSPDIPVVVPEQVYSVPPSSFPVHIEAPPTSNFHDFSNPVVSISVAEALRSHSPVVVQPTPNFNSWNGTVSEQAENVNPPTMATSVYAQMPSAAVVNPAPVLSHQHPNQSSPAPSIGSSHVDQQWTGSRLRGLTAIQPAASPQAPVHMTRSKNGLGQPPPLVVHLKDRGMCLVFRYRTSFPPKALSLSHLEMASFYLPLSSS